MKEKLQYASIKCRISLLLSVSTEVSAKLDMRLNKLKYLSFSRDAGLYYFEARKQEVANKLLISCNIYKYKYRSKKDSYKKSNKKKKKI